MRVVMRVATRRALKREEVIQLGCEEIESYSAKDLHNVYSTTAQRETVYESKMVDYVAAQLVYKKGSRKVIFFHDAKCSKLNLSCFKTSPTTASEMYYLF